MKTLICRKVGSRTRDGKGYISQEDNQITGPGAVGV